MKKDVYYVYKNNSDQFVKVVYRNKALFTQILNGAKNNFFDVSSTKKAKEILSDLFLVPTDKKFVSYGIGWNVA